jgi:hypothetical protein
MSESTGARVGVILTKIVFPLWLLTGAVLKLVDASASSLPPILIKVLGGGLGIDLMLVHRFSVAVELALVGMIWLLPRLSRPLALLMLAVFFPVLVGDMLLGASNCGCFGAVEVPPALTLVLDAGLFFGILLLGGKAKSLAMSRTLPVWPVLAAFVWVFFSFGLGFGYDVLVKPKEPAPAQADAAEPSLPPYYLPDYSSWIGRRWSEIDLAAFVKGAPDDLANGLQYLVFYRKDCEHCHELLSVYFTGALAVPTTAVAVPEKSGFPTVGLIPMECTDCRTAELPVGCDWFLQTPVLVRLDNGVVLCASEVDPSTPECFEW